MPRRWVYLGPDGRQLSVYAGDPHEAADRIDPALAKGYRDLKAGKLMPGGFLTPRSLDDEPVVLEDWRTVTG